MEKRELEVFAALVESDSIDAACKSTGLKEPEIKGIVANLEQELGHPLIIPSFGSVALTQYGKILKNNSERIASDIDQIMTAMSRVQHRLEGTVRIGCFATTHAFFCLPQFAVGVPERKFKSMVCAARDVAANMNCDLLDIGVLPESVVTPDMESIELVEEQATLSVPYGSKLFDNKAISLEELAQEPTMIVSNLYGLSQWFERIYAECGGDNARVQRPDADEYFLIKDSSPRSHFSSSIMHMLGSASETRFQIPIDADVARRKIYLAWMPEKSELVRPVVDWAIAHREQIYTALGFVPYLMHPARIENLDTMTL